MQRIAITKSSSRGSTAYPWFEDYRGLTADTIGGISVRWQRSSATWTTEGNSEGRRGCANQFYSTSCVVRLLKEMLAHYNGRNSRPRLRLLKWEITHVEEDLHPPSCRERGTGKHSIQHPRFPQALRQEIRRQDRAITDMNKTSNGSPRRTKKSTED